MSDLPAPPVLPVALLRATLEAHATAERAAHERGYLKSTLHHLGVRVPVVRAETLRWWRARSDPAALRPTVDALWATEVHELRVAAVELLVKETELLTVADAAWVEQLLRDCKTWALLDNLAIKALGPAVVREAAWLPVVERWSRDDDFWVQRAALLTHLLPMRRGEGDWTRFSRQADRVLESKEFFLRKAIGWVLREASKRDPNAVADWLEVRLDHVSGLTLREGSRNLPAPLQARLGRSP